MRTVGKKSKVIGFGTVGILTVTGLVFLFPVYALVLAAFRPGQELMRFGITLKTLIPEGLSAENILGLFTARKGAYGFWLRNSIVIMVLRTGLSVLFSAFVGYGLGMYEFKGRSFFLSLVLFLMVVPIQILILPLYRMIISLRLINTVWGVILPFVVYPFAIFFFRQYAVTLPRAFLDAGRIDGVSEIGIFFRIMMPLMIPAFGAMIILVSLQSWNDFLWPLIVMRTEKMFTIPIGLNSLLTPYGNNYDMLLSGAFVATVPIIIVFLLFQRFFISGLSAGSIKG
ncbi:carbohydrate ABC transporter permease [Sediminispirochaeta bajacaliforniensis]|uniref:carbohydrate ABC transporter permease n=1 Tax=Sediminispirochaeta bajacaliforniensis TaxID=148 RepID=UPI0003813EF3|nr:carbohydrate ABC transporter permease [Sediminispirochaeta bajacaliforniensis]